MRFGKRPKKRVPGEFPPSFTASFMRHTLPSATPAEAQSAIEHLRSKGWSEAELAQKILPFMPPPPPKPAPGTVSLPPRVSRAWLDRHLPEMHRRDIQSVVDELEQRGWSTVELGMAVLPHLLPKLPPDDADAILAGMKDLGMTDAQIARLARSG